jgi:phage FluMu gp28-like protein
MKSTASPKAEPSRLYAYQREWISDPARFCLAVKSRQIGWTFGTTLKHVRRRIAKGGLTVWVSASERQSIEAIEYVKIHNEAVQQAFDYDEIEFPGVDETVKQVTYRHNGARIMGMSANPKTVRGYAGDVVLDEFGFHRDQMAIWRGAMAIVSRGYKLDVISTPNGQQGKYWDLCRDAGVPALGGSERQRWTKGQWSVHWCDIEMAVMQGCPIDMKAMREAVGDEDTWLQEYCCVFLADAENYIPMELVIACESEQATLELPANFRPQGRLYFGVDIGRRKDRTVGWLKEELGDVLITRAVIVLERTPFHAQFSILEPFVEMAHRSCFDATGIGAQMAEDMARKYGSKVEQVVFNLENKEKMATATKSSFENRRERIPSAAFIRRSINAVKRYSSTTGHFRFDAERTDQGHADEFWACALATAAAAGAPPAAYFSVDPLQQPSAVRGAFSRAAERGRRNEDLEPMVTVERGGERRGTWGGMWGERRGERKSLWE